MTSEPIVKRSASFGLGALVLGIGEAVSSYLAAAVTWEGLRTIALWLIPAFVLPVAAAGGVGFGAGLWMARLRRRAPRARFLGWWALGLGAAFFQSVLWTASALRLFQAPMPKAVLFLTVGVPGTAAVVAVAFVLVATRARSEAR